MNRRRFGSESHLLCVTISLPMEVKECHELLIFLPWNVGHDVLGREGPIIAPIHRNQARI
jgi:hypothetical protein